MTQGNSQGETKDLDLSESWSTETNGGVARMRKEDSGVTRVSLDEPIANCFTGVRCER